MPSIHPNKVAAAVAAVLQYAAETDAVPAVPLVGVCADRPGSAVSAIPPLWGWAGRQEAMRDRAVWQRRLAKSW